MGSLTGVAAAVPMTVAMEAMYRRLPPGERQPLPPRQITDALAERAGVDDDLSEPEMRATTLFNHLAYSALCGVVYATVAPRLPMARVVSGTLFALSVWMVSYLGWLPAARIFPSAFDQTARRNGLMIAAHVIWGASMGLILPVLQRAR